MTKVRRLPVNRKPKAVARHNYPIYTCPVRGDGFIEKYLNIEGVCLLAFVKFPSSPPKWSDLVMIESYINSKQIA